MTAAVVSVAVAAVVSIAVVPAPPPRSSSSWVLVLSSVVLSFLIGIAWVSSPLGGGRHRGRVGAHMCARWPWARRRCFVHAQPVLHGPQPVPRELLSLGALLRATLLCGPRSRGPCRVDPACCGVLRASWSRAACAFWDPASMCVTQLLCCDGGGAS
jgi:hypothetical protein